MCLKVVDTRRAAKTMPTMSQRNPPFIPDDSIRSLGLILNSWDRKAQSGLAAKIRAR
jgi:hypothetical protein